MVHLRETGTGGAILLPKAEATDFAVGMRNRPQLCFNESVSPFTTLMNK